jgi:hypothetical protein
MTSLNFVLETTNGAVSLLTAFFLIFLTVYLVQEFRSRDLKWWKIALSLPVGMAVALALYIEKAGALTTRIIIFVWRVHGGNIPFSDVELFLLMFGAMATAIGLLMMMRILSRARYGNWPWLLVSVVTLIYVGITTAFYIVS